jgi:hypothetical protein
MKTTTTPMKALAVLPVLALGACMSTPELRPTPASMPVPAVKVIRAEGAGGYVLPDGTRVVRDETGGFQLPNGAYVQRTTSGDLLLPNGNVCRPTGRDFVCP